MQDILLNLVPGAFSPEVHLSQYDKGRVIPFKLVDDKSAYSVPEGAIVKVADAIVKTASGSIASFSVGGDDMPMKSLKINIVPKQSGSGDASPTNKRPISGTDTVGVTRAGGNLLKVTRESGLITTGGVTYNIDGGRATVNGISTSNYPTVILGTFGLKKGTYTLKKKITGNVPSDAYLYIILENTGLASAPATRGTDSQTFTLDEDRDGIRAVLCAEVIGKTWNNVQIENWIESDNAPLNDYEPYEAESKSIPLGQTVYGGVLDVVSGKLSITKIAEALANANLIKQSQGYYKMIPLRPIKTTGTVAGQTDAISSCFVRTGGAGVYNNTVDNAFTVGSLYIDNNLIAIRANAYANETEIKNALGNEVIVYEIATPIEIQLTPTEVKTLLGSNNVWSESGTVEVEYRADTTLAYNELLKLIANM